jgi:hypothetical protein
LFAGWAGRPRLALQGFQHFWADCDGSGDPPWSVSSANENARPRPGESNQPRPARPQTDRIKRVVRRSSITFITPFEVRSCCGARRSLCHRSMALPAKRSPIRQVLVSRHRTRMAVDRRRLKNNKKHHLAHHTHRARQAHRTYTAVTQHASSSAIGPRARVQQARPVQSGVAPSDASAGRLSRACA